MNFYVQLHTIWRCATFYTQYTTPEYDSHSFVLQVMKAFLQQLWALVPGPGGSPGWQCVILKRPSLVSANDSCTFPILLVLLGRYNRLYWAHRPGHYISCSHLVLKEHPSSMQEREEACHNYCRGEQCRSTVPDSCAVLTIYHIINSTKHM